MLEELAQAGQPSKRPVGSWAREVAPKIRYTHDAMIDMVVENPAIHQNQIAAHFGFTPSWVSTVFTSDAFKAKLAQRRAEVVDPVLQMSLRERIEALTSQSLRVLQEKLARPASEVPDLLALKALELGAKAMGLGGNQAPQVVVTSEDRLASLAHRLIALKGQAQEVVDVTSRDVP